MAIVVTPWISELPRIPFIHIFYLLKAEISGLHPECCDWTNVVDVTLDSTPYDSILLESNAVLILKQLPTANPTARNLRGFSSVQKHCLVCSLVFQDISHVLATANRTAGVESWPLRIFPGSPHRDYHIFCAQGKSSMMEGGSLLDHAQATSRVHHTLYLIAHPESLLSACAPQTFPDNIRCLQMTHESSQKELGALLEDILDFEGKPLVMNTCRVCRGTEFFKKTGDWTIRYEPVAHQLTALVNATLALEFIGSSSRDGPDDAGEWDEWKAPLLNGSSVIAAYQRFSIEGIAAFHYGRTYTLDYVTFITAKPKRVQGSRSLTRLLSPLSPGVWLCTFACIGALFIVLEIIMHAHCSGDAGQNIGRLPDHSIIEVSSIEIPMFRQLLSSPHRQGLTLIGLLKPALGQGGTVPTIERAVIKEGLIAVRLLFGLWFLVLIVLGSAYQSQMISCIASPQYANPPKTFRELANSHFKPLAIVWTDEIESDFASLNTWYSKRLIDTVAEYGYVDEDCYVRIFRGDYACIGLRSPIMHYAMIFLVDVKGRTMFEESRDALFPRFMTFAMSKHYVKLHDLLNFCIGSIDNSGLTLHWSANLLSKNVQRGKKIARKKQRTIGVYSGKAEQREVSVVPVVVRILVMGAASASVQFAYELSGTWIGRLAALQWRLLQSMIHKLTK